MNKEKNSASDPVRQASLEYEHWRRLQESPAGKIPLEELPLSLPIVNAIGAEAPSTPLRNTVLVAAQHLLGTTLPLIDWVHTWGVPYSQMFICGKVYSSHQLVIWRLTQLGVTVNSNSMKLSDAELEDPDFSYDNRFGRDVLETLQQAAAALDRLSDDEGVPRQLLVLDDGASTIRHLAAEPALARGARVAAVEQTRLGTRIIQNASADKLFFPVVNVAESAPKLGPEATLIGQSVIDEILIRIKRIEGPHASLISRKVLIFGYGCVGRAVAQVLKNHDVELYATDNDPRALQRALDDGLKTIPSIETVDRFELTIGCTGSSILSETWLSAQKGRIYLASASSSDVEFQCISKLPMVSRINPAPEIDDSDHQRIHADLIYDSGAAEVILLNGGFPVNFNGALDPIPADKIQLTRALLLSGLRQAIDCTTTGLVAFNDRDANFIQERYDRLKSDNSAGDTST